METLYVSDLDGTLMRNDRTLSPYTVDTINTLVRRGMLFSYATARSHYTAGKITEGLAHTLPVIVYNGTFILENGTQKRLLSNAFTDTEVRYVLEHCTAADVFPFTYAFVEGRERFSYVPEHLSPDMQEFLDMRGADTRKRPVTKESLYDGEIFHFVAMDTAEKLFPLYEKFKDTFRCHYGNDLYSGKPWLELHPKNATKANAIRALKKILGCDRIVAFGDGKNDVSMFEIADACYAVENADPALKSIATAVIGSNETDAVAKWLLANFNTEGK